MIQLNKNIDLNEFAHPRNGRGQFIRVLKGIHLWGYTRKAVGLTDSGVRFTVELVPGETLWTSKAGNYFKSNFDDRWQMVGTARSPFPKPVDIVKPSKLELSKVDSAPYIKLSN